MADHVAEAARRRAALADTGKDLWYFVPETADPGAEMQSPAQSLGSEGGRLRAQVD